MKMKPEHYAHVARAIAATGYNTPENAEDYAKCGLSHTRFAWDLARAAILVPYFCDELYSYLNDDHITTALEKIAVGPPLPDKITQPLSSAS